MPDDATLAQLQERLQHRFRDAALLIEALTHPSYLQDHPESKAHNQRLEFLGDSVLHFILTDALYREFPMEREGALSKRRAALSKGGFLSPLARELGLEAGLLLGKSEEDTGGRGRDSILEDAIEAIIGAIYLDSDLETTRRAVLGWYGPLPARLGTSEKAENPKGRLQELVQPELGNGAVRYELIETTGPRHASEYEVAVFVQDRQLGTGRGSSKKAAEEEAARAALEALKQAGMEEAGS